MPLTEDGEIDLDRLSAAGTETLRAERAAPRNEIEEKLAEIWQQVLGTGSPVGIHDNFFHLGGHSLLAAQLIARLRDTFHIELALDILLEQAPTIVDLARHIDAVLWATQTPTTNIGNHEEGEL